MTVDICAQCSGTGIVTLRRCYHCQGSGLIEEDEDYDAYWYTDEFGGIQLNDFYDPCIQRNKQQPRAAEESNEKGYQDN